LSYVFLISFVIDFSIKLLFHSKKRLFLMKSVYQLWDKFRTSDKPTPQFSPTDVPSSSDEKKSESDQLQTWKQIVDNVTSIVMLCDITPDNRIFYINRAGRQIFQSYCENLKTMFGEVDLGSIVGTSIHKFHKDPNAIRKILLDIPNLPHKANVHIGDIVFETSVSPIFSEDQSLFCYMACWTDVTGFKLIERKEKEERELREFLEQKIIDINRDLNQLSDKIIFQIENTFEIMSKAKWISKNTKESLPVIKEATDETQIIVKTVEKSSDTIYNLNVLSLAMDEVVSLIESLVEQSNLLSLNASIESARAGSSGKGFSVVAREMARLSEKTGESAKKIKSITKQIHVGINESVAGIQSIKKNVDSINTMIHTIGTEVDNIYDGIVPLSSLLDMITESIQEESVFASKISTSLEQISQYKKISK
jgi:methyl-accepting chemotaxis protein